MIFLLTGWRSGNDIGLSIGVGGLGYDSRSGQVTLCRQRLATAARFLLSCVAQTLSYGDVPRHLLLSWYVTSSG